MLSIVIPTFNEAAGIADTLGPLQWLRRCGHEIILADGGSEDGTVDIARGWVDSIVIAPRGRARQMNAGAREADGRVLLFLHADTGLPAEGDDRGWLEALKGADWGFFNLRLSGRRPIFRLIAGLINRRSRLTGIGTGDQAIFLRTDLFDAVGGYPPQPLMEDLALCRALRSAVGRPSNPGPRVTTSSRRWERHGVARTVLLMWWLRLRYYLGTPTEHLARSYRSS